MAAVQMIDTSIIRVHEQAAFFTRNVETDGLPERLQPPIIAHATTRSRPENASKPTTVRWLRDISPPPPRGFLSSLRPEPRASFGSMLHRS